MRVSPQQYLRLPLQVHALLAGIPLQDVSAVDLPGGGPGRTVSDVRALLGGARQQAAGPAVRFLFWLRIVIGRLFRWDAPAHDRPELSYLSRVPAALAGRSVEPPGTPNGSFRILYVVEREAVEEIRNATVHAFLAFCLEEIAGGYRLYLAVYVQPVSRFTGLYMALIEPFRRFIVYPSILGRVRRAWAAQYG
jgi:hypothetical protein